MPRYFFDVIDPDMPTLDEEGLVLTDIEAAKRQACRALGDIARDCLRSEKIPQTMSINVRTEDGSVICTVSLTYSSANC